LRLIKNLMSLKLYNTGGYTTIKLGEMYNVHRSTISYIVNNKTFKHLLED